MVKGSLAEPERQYSAWLKPQVFATTTLLMYPLIAVLVVLLRLFDYFLRINYSNDFYWRQKSSSLNIVQYNTTSRPIIVQLQIYTALPKNLINRTTLEYVPGLTQILLSSYQLQPIF